MDIICREKILKDLESVLRRYVLTNEQRGDFYDNIEKLSNLIYVIKNSCNLLTPENVKMLKEYSSSELPGHNFLREFEIQFTHFDNTTLPEYFYELVYIPYKIKEVPKESDCELEISASRIENKKDKTKKKLTSVDFDVFNTF